MNKTIGSKNNNINNNRNSPCNRAIMSEQYIDYIVPYKDLDVLKKENPLAECIQIINESFAILHVNKEALIPMDPKKRDGLIYHDVPYYMIPNLYAPYHLTYNKPSLNESSFYELYGKQSLSAAEILDMHNYTLMPLTGRNVIIGIIDSGIDYTHSAFVYADNTTKILSIWDQSIQSQAPEGFKYGTEYSREQINKALQSNNPFEIVPSTDQTGHGTFLAGVAAGLNVDEQEGFTIQQKNFVGAAPDSDLIIVKLKRAKDYIKKYYLINKSTVPIYQSTDLMMAVKYLNAKAKSLGRPLVICIGFGTNQGGHDGNSVTELYLESAARELGNSVVVAAGNEADKEKHYTGTLTEAGQSQSVQINVSKGTSGFVATIWTYDIMTVSITSPTGEMITRIPLRRSFKDEVGFLLENTKIFIKYSIFEMLTGGNLISIRFNGPTEGLWTITIYGDFVVSGRFDVWMTRDDLMIAGSSKFMSPEPYTTVTEPSTASSVLTIGAYNPETESLYIPSGRGPTRNIRVKPDLVAPGVHVFGPLAKAISTNGNAFGTTTGTSAAAAIATGASALMLQWGMELQGDSHMNTQKIKNYLALGASKPKEFSTKEWGYGKLKLKSTFEKLKEISIR